MKNSILLIFTMILGSSLFAQFSNPYYAPPFEIEKTDKLITRSLVGPMNPSYYKDDSNNVILNIGTGTIFYNGTNLGQCYNNTTSNFFQIKIDATYNGITDITCLKRSPNILGGLSCKFNASNGDVMYIGATTGFLNDIAFELRDSLDNVRSFKTIGGYHNEKPFILKRSVDGGYIGIADYTGFGDGDIGGDDSIKCGDYYDTDIWLFKTDSVGNVIKSRTFGGLYPDTHGDLHISDNGDITIATTVLAGGIDCELGGCITANTGWGDRASDILVVRLDKELNLLWHKCYGGSSIEGTWGDSKLVSDGNGGFYIATRTSSSDGLLANHPWNGVPERTYHDSLFGADLWVFHIDQGGTILQSKTFPFNYSEHILITRSLDGHIWVAVDATSYNRYHSNLTNSDTCRKSGVVILHLDNNLNLLHSRTMFNDPYAIIPLEDTTVLITFGYYPETLPCHQDLMPLYDTSLNYNSAQGLAILKVRGRTATNLPKTFDKSNYKIYPNPVQSGQLRVDFDKPSIVGIQLTDASGRVVLSQKLREQQNNISVSHLTSGVYFASIIDPNSKEKITTQKVIIKNP